MPAHSIRHWYLLHPKRSRFRYGPSVERARSERALGEDEMPFRLPGGGGGAEDERALPRVGPHLRALRTREEASARNACSRVWSGCPTAAPPMSAARARQRRPPRLPALGCRPLQGPQSP